MPWNALEWPTVPVEQRPQVLYHNTSLTPQEDELLRNKGWIPVDTRLMSSRTDQERIDSIKAVLEGIRRGTIDGDKTLKDFLDIESYTVGIKGKGAQAKDVGDFGAGEIDVLLDFGGGRTSQTFKDKLKALDSEPKKVKKPLKKTKT